MPCMGILKAVSFGRRCTTAWKLSKRRHLQDVKAFAGVYRLSLCGGSHRSSGLGRRALQESWLFRAFVSTTHRTPHPPASPGLTLTTHPDEGAGHKAQRLNRLLKTHRWVLSRLCARGFPAGSQKFSRRFLWSCSPDSSDSRYQAELKPGKVRKLAFPGIAQLVMGCSQSLKVVLVCFNYNV